MHESDINHSSHGQERHGLCNLQDSHRKLRMPALCEEALDGIGDHPEKITFLTCDARAARLAYVFEEYFSDYIDGVPGNIDAAGPA